MKRVVLAACVTCFALTVSAHTRDEQTQHLGARNDGVTPQTATVPESVPTIALTLISLAGVGVFGAFLRGRKSAA